MIFRHAFTMIELIFVIVILGILAAVALPKFTGSVDQAYLSKAQSKVASIRMGLSNWRSKALLKGESLTYPDLNTTPLFNAVAEGETDGTGAGQWHYNATTGKFEFHTGSATIVFSYDKDSGKFTCESPTNLCQSFE